MIDKLSRIGFYLKDIHRINYSMSRGALAASARAIDPNRPNTWEFSAFSQNGEDGIIDYCSRKIIDPNSFFIEIGAGTGIENNCAYLSIARRFSGIFVESDRRQSMRCKYMHEYLNLGIKSLNMIVNDRNMKELLDLSPYSNPDVMSLDIDSFDFYLAETMLKSGFTPKIWSVEYNSTFGPEKSLTVIKDDKFTEIKEKTRGLYYGASMGAWRSLFAGHGYRFICVESNGVNAFFVKPEYFRGIDFEKINGYSFRENYYQIRKFGAGFDRQYEIIKDCEYRNI
jgi:hypothetical protein